MQTRINVPSGIEAGGTEGMGIPKGPTKERGVSTEISLIRVNTVTRLLEYSLDGNWFTTAAGSATNATKSTDFIAILNNVYPVDTTANVVNITLKKNEIGLSVIFTDARDKWSVNSIIIKGNGAKIDGSTQDKVISGGGSIELVWLGDSIGFKSSNQKQTTATKLTSGNFPFGAVVNSIYFIELPIASSIMTMPSTPVAGDTLEIKGCNGAFFPGTLRLRRSASGEKMNGSTADITIIGNEERVKFVYSGIASIGWKSMLPLLNRIDAAWAGDFNTLPEGDRAVGGEHIAFTNGPVSIGSMHGFVSVKHFDSIVTQELHFTTSPSTTSRTRLFSRVGKKLGNTVTWNSEWVETVRAAMHSNGVQTGGTVLKTIAGKHRIKDPIIGTPDHKINDDYLVTVTDAAEFDYSAGPLQPNKHLSALNVRTGVMWTNMNHNGLWDGFRSDLAAFLAVSVNQSLVIDGRSAATYVQVNSFGNQSITIARGKFSAVHDSNTIHSWKQGDTIEISNVRKGTLTTTLTAEIDVHAADGENIGKSHTMSGIGKLTLRYTIINDIASWRVM